MAGVDGLILGACKAVSVPDWLPDLTAWTSDDWSALGTNLTAGIALAAGVVALGQFREARRLRLEQAQPYVACFVERTQGHDQALDIVIRNFGTTIARDIRIEVMPPIMRAWPPGQKPEPVFIPGQLPALVPGQEWRTWWDYGPARSEKHLISRHDAVVSYRDSQGAELPPIPSVLDWAEYEDVGIIVTKGMHEAATALEDVNRTLKSFKYRASGGLEVFARDADAVDERLPAEFERRKAAHAESTGQVMPGSPASDKLPAAGPLKRMGHHLRRFLRGRLHQ